MPPKLCSDAGAFLKSKHSSYSFRFGVHSAQLASPGATRSSTRPPWVKPADSIDVMLSLSQPLANWNPYWVPWA